MCYDNLTENIKIFISYHKPINELNLSFVEMFPTNLEESINIAHKNEYCELRTQYYVWKNCSYGYVGFFQFRRYLDISREVYQINSKKKALPYIVERLPNIEKIPLDKVLALKEKYDVIAPIPEYNGISVKRRYALSKGHRKEDLDMIVNILLDKYPDFKDAVDVYLNGSYEYYGNMFFMRKYIYDEYCSWLFNILFDFDKKATNILPKTNGYLGERLFGIYFTYLKLQNKLSLGELPRIHFSGYDDSYHNFKRQKIINFLLPPGSKIKGTLRNILYLGGKNE